MAKRRVDRTEPLAVLELLRASVRRDADWYRQHADRVIDVMRGQPCRHGNDGRAAAARLVEAFDRNPRVLREAASVLRRAKAARA